MPDEAALSARGKLSLASEIFGVYGRVRWTLARRGLRETLAALRDARLTGAEPAAWEAEAQTDPARLSRVVWRTLRLLPTDSRCLMQALVLSALLARRGIRSELILGVRPGPPFTAHAWVELQGRILPAGSDADYQRLASL